MTAAETIAAVRGHGGTFARDKSGGHVIRGKSLPANLVREVRENARAIKTAIALERVEPLPLIAGPTVISKASSAPKSFLDEQEAKFDLLCAEFGIAVARPVPKR